jgi:Zn-dependent M28 family amino/carboxypeptidase
VAFVFFDLEEMGLFGSAGFAAKHREVTKNTLLINFDCISDGDTILLMPNRKTQKRWGDAITTAYPAADGKTVSICSSSRVFYPSDQASFPYAIGVAAFRRSSLGLYLGRIHTPRDTVLDETNLSLLRGGTLTLIDRL